MEKTCRDCGLTKNINVFFAQPRNKDKLGSYCKECTYKRAKFCRNIPLDKRLKRKHKHPGEFGSFEYHKSQRLKATYNIDLTDFNEMVKDQEGKCIICEKHQRDMKTSICVDHCHTTGHIRGLLCRECNTGLGLFKDNSLLLQRAAIYLDVCNNEIELTTLN